MISSLRKDIVVIFVHCFPPAKGGLEYLISEVKKALDSKYDVHVITGQGLSLDSYKTFSNYTSDNPTNIHRLKLNLFWQYLSNKFLNKIIFKISFFSPFYFGPILIYPSDIKKIISKSSYIIAAGLPTKSIFDAYKFANLFRKPLFMIPAYHNKNYYNNCYFFQRAFNYSQKIYCLTPKEKKDLILNYNLPDNKISILPYSPYSLKQINSQQKKVDFKHRIQNIKHKTITLGYVGQINSRKNLTVFKELLDNHLINWQHRHLNAKVLFAGARTNSSDSIETIFKDYLSLGILKIIYNFPDNKKDDIYKNIDIFVMPSIEESLGIVNFEAIYHAIPIMVNTNCAFADLLKTKFNLFSTVNDISENIENLINNPTNIKKIVNNQYNVFKHYNYNNFQTKLI